MNLLRPYNAEYFLAFEQYSHFSLIQFSNVLMEHPKTTIGSITLAELCSFTNHPHGLYFVFENAQLQYIGKSTSRSFIERIPAHFDQREKAWFNTLPSKVNKASKVGDYAAALSQSLNMDILMMGINDKRTAMRLETVFRSFLQPTLNAAKPRNFTGTELLNSYSASITETNFIIK